MNKYFSDYDINKFKDYSKAETIEEKNKIYNKYLYFFIDKQIESVMNKFNKYKNIDIMQNYEDIKQNIHISILTKVLPTIDSTRIQAIQSFIYNSINNALINLLNSNKTKYNLKFDYNISTDIMTLNNNLDEDLEEEENKVTNIPEPLNITNDIIIQTINNKIDEKINEQINANCSPAVYLQLLKQYIIDNNYNAEGFDNYCMKKMKIKKSYYMNISHSLNFKTIAFKTRKINN